LTYWVILAFLTAAEHSARVLLSWVPRYYEVKLLLLLWMMRSHGAETIYRSARVRLRR